MPDTTDTTIAWPDWMPPVEVGPYGIQEVDRRAKSGVDMAGQYRNEFNVDECECQCSVVMNQDTAAFFEAFQRDLLDHGNVWITMPLWVAGELQSHRVRFKDQPQAGNSIGANTTYSFTLILERRSIPATDYTDLAWPPSLPNAEVDSYGIQPTDRRLKSDMEIGAVYRNEYGTDENQCSCTIELYQDEAALFEAFERDTLDDGTKWFDASLWVGGRLCTHRVRFRDHPRVSKRSSLMTTYSWTFDVSQRELIGPEYASLLLHYSPESIRNLKQFLCPFINETIPACMTGIEV
jgi:hypothetical protein